MDTGYKYASCIKLTCHGETKCVGADKISHFFQQGFMLHELAGKFDRHTAEAFSLFTEGLLYDLVFDGRERTNEYLGGPQGFGIHNPEFFSVKNQKQQMLTKALKDHVGNASATASIRQYLAYIDAENIFASHQQFVFHDFGQVDLYSYKRKWGGIRPGIARKSHADHQANLSGMSFWNKLASANSLQGFSFNICDYVDDLDRIVECHP